MSDADAWTRFERQHIRKCVGVSTRCLFVPIGLNAVDVIFAIFSGVQHWLFGFLFIVLCLVIKFGSTYVVRMTKSSDGHLTWLLCILHQVLCVFAALLWVFARSFQTSEITRHRSFVSGMLGVIHVSFTCLYLPLTMHVLVVTFGLIFFWTLWHSMTNCISVAYVAWGVVWAVWELYFYTVSQHQEWSLFKYCEEIETGRLKAEAWERALRGVVRSVVDGTCECDLEGIILRASPQFAELVGMEQFHLVGQSLSSLCLNAECDRVSTFIQQCVRGDQLTAAATIETILCGKPDGECLRLSLFVAQIPIANGALLAGVQLQGRGNETCHDDPSDTDSKVEPEEMCVFGEGRDDVPSLVDFLSLHQQEAVPRETDSLSSLSHTFALSASTRAQARPSESIAFRCDSASQTLVSSKTEASTQTHDRKPPLVKKNTGWPRPESHPGALSHPERALCSVSFRSNDASKTFMPQYRSTPRVSIEFLLMDVICRLNLVGSGCCLMHVNITAMCRVLQKMHKADCRHDLVGAETLQCAHCMVFQLSEESDECEVCGRWLTGKMATACC